MKILFVNTYDTGGGAAKASYRLHSSLQALGIDSKMIVKNKTSNDDSIIEINTFDKRNIYISKPYDYIVNKIKNFIYRFYWKPYPNRTDLILSDLRSISIFNAFNKIEFDILHLHWINHRFLDLEELYNVNKPIIWTLHDSWPFTGVCHIFNNCNKYTLNCGSCPELNSNIENDISRQVLQRKLEIFNKIDLHIIAPSTWIGECASKSLLLKDKPIYIIPNGLNVNLYSPKEKSFSRSELGLDLHKKYILYGAMNAITDKNKGFYQFQAAVNKLETDIFNEEIEILIIGTTALADDLGLKIKTHVLGVITSEYQMIQIYNSADVTIVPSLSENLSYVIMESLSCGIPVVAFDTGGNKDLIEHKKNGYLAKSYSVEDLSNGIIWSIENNIDNSLSFNARNKIIENFSLEKTSRQYLKLYSELTHD